MVHALAATTAPSKPVASAVAAAAAGNDSAARIPSGSSATTIDVAGRSIDLFTYKPDNYDGQRFILVFHGMLRNADEYRDHAIAMGKRYKALIVAPRFSSDQFSSACYQQGGLRVDGQIQPRDQWTWQLIPNMVAQVRSLESRPNMPFWMIGHSAGGQFLIRMAGFVDVGAERIVVANPGTYLLPSCRLEYPLGFGGLPEELAGDHALRRYLEQPITVYLGEGDTLRDEDLDTSPDADAQGLNRWQRGRGAFRCAQELAQRNGWAFNWKLVTAPSVDHDHEKMFNHGRCDEAFNLAATRPTAIVRSSRGAYRSSWAEMGNSRKAKRLL
ncbi:MAG: hypothetical protein K8T25_17755 [Planctomycetia bacterium]|nr:hypothetical protein [Planctomycetia bacterium]